MPLMRRTGSWLFLALGMIIVSVGCTGQPSTPANLPPTFFPIDAQFREYYEAMGGEAALGVALSPGFPRQGTRYQYTTYALMAYDPSRRVEERYFLAPVGKELDITWFPSPVEAQGGGGQAAIEIYAEFTRAYDLLGGEKNLGQAVTGPRYNPQYQRIEQLFEGMGLYRLLEEPTYTARLLGYGAWMCGLRCQYTLPAQATPMRYPLLDPRFLKAAQRFGSDFTGLPVSVAFPSPDGNLEVILENVVMVIPAGEAGEVTLSPVAERLGIMPEALQTAQPRQGFTFVEVKDQKGHLVPDQFIEYLAKRGGLSVSGAPIGELMDLGRDIRRQCFVNLCLELDEGALEPMRVRPYPLGYLYAQLNGRLWVDETVNDAEPLPGETGAGETGNPDQELVDLQRDMLAQPSPNAQETTLLVTEGQEWVKPAQRQKISVQVLENQQPKANAQVRLIVQLPKSKMKSYDFPPTGADGWTTLRLRPIDAPNNTLIPYQVCTPLAIGGEYCVQGDFSIRNKP